MQAETNRRPRRGGSIWWFWRIGLSTLLGVLFTWGIAWYVAIHPYGGWGCDIHFRGQAWYLDAQGQRVPVQWYHVTRGAFGRYPRFENLVESNDEVTAFHSKLRDNPALVYEEHEQQDVTLGWPWRSMAFHSDSVHQRRSGQEIQSSLAWHDLFQLDRRTAKRLGYPWGAPGGGDFRFPIGILRTGFVLDTLFFAAIFAFLLCAPGSLRRYRRRKRGQCLECGYRLAGNVTGICPECGSLMAGQGHGPLPPTSDAWDKPSLLDAVWPVVIALIMAVTYQFLMELWGYFTAVRAGQTAEPLTFSLLLFGFLTIGVWTAPPCLMAIAACALLSRRNIIWRLLVLLSVPIACGIVPQLWYAHHRGRPPLDFLTFSQALTALVHFGPPCLVAIVTYALLSRLTAKAAGRRRQTLAAHSLVSSCESTPGLTTADTHARQDEQ